MQAEEQVHYLWAEHNFGYYVAPNNGFILMILQMTNT